MRVLLISPSVRASLSDGLPDGISTHMSKNFGLYPWLGICYIAAFLRRKGIEVGIMETEAEGLSKEETADKVKEWHPDTVGISSMTFTFLYALDLARRIKNKLDVPIVFGGAHVSIYPQEVISHKCIDLGVIGEGEITFFEVVNLLKHKRLKDAHRELREIPGLVFKDNGETIITERRETIKNLDDLPFPAVDLLKTECYYGCNHKRPFITMMTSRGCPYQCSFCSKEPWGVSFRYYSAERIVDEIEYYVRKLGVKAIDFFDDAFTLNQQRTAEMIKLIKRRNIKFDFGMMTRVDMVNERLINELKEIGCKIMSFGIESGVERILKILNKNITMIQVKNAFKWANEAGISTVGFFMVGNPTETKEDILQTIRLIKEINADYIKANILIPYPGSKLYRNMLENGEITEDYWGKVTLTEKVTEVPLANRELSRREIVKFRNRINYMPYLRWRSNVLKFKKVKSFYDIKRTFDLLRHAFFHKEV